MISRTEYKPTSILAEYIHCYYFNRSNYFDYQGLIYPAAHQELFFNFGDYFIQQQQNGALYTSRQWISGIQPQVSTVQCSGNHHTAGVIFKPWGLYAAFGIPADQLYNTAIDSAILYDFNKEFNREFANNQIEQEDFFECIEHSLLKALKRSKLTVTMQRIANDLECENLTELSNKMARSKKSIIQSFHKMVGTSPHKFFTLQKICATIEALEHNPQITLTALAYEQGFYDQSHFIRVFRQHTGLSPKEFKTLFIKKVNNIQF